MKTFIDTCPEALLDEKAINKWTDYHAWIKKRIKANRFHFMSNLDLKNWPAGKYLDYKGKLYFPTHLDWPEGRDYGILYVKLIGYVRKLQAGASTNITIDDQKIRIQVSREIAREKKSKNQKLGKLNFVHPMIKTS